MRNKLKNIYSKIKKFTIDNKKIATISVIIFVLVGVIVGLNINTPKFYLQSPKNSISSESKDEIIIPAVLSKLSDNKYPAASVGITFDKNKLEFVGIKLGTMETYDDYNEESKGEKRFKVPNWVYNVDVANQKGEINAMYLDTTASKNAYNIEGFKKKEKDILFRLVFKLKDSVIPKDKIDINIEEVVFATITGDVDKTTLSTKDNYGKLKTEDAIIKLK
ncbi:MAG: hypothetical protein RRZ84_03470 [Romboutsia sp.]